MNSVVFDSQIDLWESWSFSLTNILYSLSSPTNLDAISTGPSNILYRLTLLTELSNSNWTLTEQGFSFSGVSKSQSAGVSPAIIYSNNSNSGIGTEHGAWFLADSSSKYFLFSSNISCFFDCGLL